MPDGPIPYVIAAALIVGALCVCVGIAALVDAFRGEETQADIYRQFPGPPPTAAYRQFDRGDAWRSCGEGYRVEQLIDAPRPRASIV